MVGLQFKNALITQPCDFVPPLLSETKEKKKVISALWDFYSTLGHNKVSGQVIHCFTLCCERLFGGKGLLLLMYNMPAEPDSVVWVFSVFRFLYFPHRCFTLQLVGAVCLPEGGTSPAQTDPIGLLWRLRSQTDLRPELGNLIHLRWALQFQSQHGCSARAQRWRKLRCNRKRGTLGFHHQRGWLIA